MSSIFLHFLLHFKSNVVEANKIFVVLSRNYIAKKIAQIMSQSRSDWQPGFNFFFNKPKIIVKGKWHATRPWQWFLNGLLQKGCDNTQTKK